MARRPRADATQARICIKCGVMEAFEDCTEECCWATDGTKCVFPNDGHTPAAQTAHNPASESWQDGSPARVSWQGVSVYGYGVPWSDGTWTRRPTARRFREERLAAVVHGQDTLLAAVNELAARGAAARNDQWAELRVLKAELRELKDMVRKLAAGVDDTAGTLATGQRISLMALGAGADSSTQELKTQLESVSETMRDLHELVAASLAQGTGQCASVLHVQAPPQTTPPLALSHLPRAAVHGVDESRDGGAAGVAFAAAEHEQATASAGRRPKYSVQPPSCGEKALRDGARTRDS